MASDKRISRLPVSNLVQDSREIKQSLTRLLDVDKTVIVSSPELKSLALSIKSCYKDYSSVTHDAICSLFSCGSTCEGTQLKESKYEMRNDVVESLAEISALLNDLGEDMISNLSDITKCNGNASGRSESVISDFSDSQEPDTLLDIPFSHTTDSPLVVVDSEHSSHVYRFPSPVPFSSRHVDNSDPSVVVPTASFKSNVRELHDIPISHTSGFQQYPINALYSTSVHASVPLSVPQPYRPLVSPPVLTPLGVTNHFDGASHLKINPYEADPTKFSMKDKPHSHRYELQVPELKPDPSHTTPRNPYQFSPVQTPNLTRHVSEGYVPHSPHRDSTDFPLNIPNNIPPPNFAPYASVSQHVPHRTSPFQPYNNPIQPTATQPSFDPASFHLVKQQLFRKSAEPFSSDPEKFNSWMESLINKTEGLNLSARDHLEFLQANTEGDALAIVNKYISIGGRNPSTTLDRIINELRFEFGSSVKIANALISRLDEFPTIKSCSQVSELKDLLTICLHIEANMHHSNGLHDLNAGGGIKKVWLKLPENLQNALQSRTDDYRSRNDNSYPPFRFIVEFLTKKCRELSDPLFQRPTQVVKRREFTTLMTEQTSIPKLSEPSDVTVENLDVALRKTGISCPLHDLSNHCLPDCRKFARMTYEQKLEVVKDHRLCFKCLGSNHTRAKCRSNSKCKLCGGDHISVMHPTSRENYSEESSKTSLRTNVNNSDEQDCSKVVLVDLFHKGSTKKPLRCYAILDEQSSSSFADPIVADYFTMLAPTEDYSLSTLCGSSTQFRGQLLKNLSVKGIKEKTKLSLPTLSTNPYIPNCKSEIATPSMVKTLPRIRNFAHHFCEFDEEAQVLLLLGRDSGMCIHSRCLNKSLPFVHKTSLGWALVGGSSSVPSNSKAHCTLRTSVEHFSSNPCFQYQEKWTLKELDIFKELADDEKAGPSQEDRHFLHKMSTGLRVDEEGRLVFPLPFKKDHPHLPNNSKEVLYRSKSTLERLARDPLKVRDCTNVMQKYLNANHVEEVPFDEKVPIRPNHAWWIPVFAVTHPKKQKTRLVFDSSAQYHGQKMNDHLIPGPPVMNHLKSVLIGFRNGYIGFSCDVECMFHSFLLPPEDRDYLRFYWYGKNDPSQGLVQYRAKVHIFGNCSSPAVAALGLRYAASSNPVHESVREFVENQFYVDDGLGSADSAKDAISVLSDTIAALRNHKIRLHKICSSSAEVMNAFPPSERAELGTVELEEDPTSSALGHQWDTASDRIVIRSDIPDRPFTRRGILAVVNSIFDPLGICSPILLDGKHLQRQLVSSCNELDSSFWDEELPTDMKPNWDSWMRSLHDLTGLSVPRSYRNADFGDVYSTELHGYCDASEDGTGYVIYLRSINAEGEINVAFVTASSKIAPKSPPTIPRLELCAALDLSNELTEVAEKLNVCEDDVFLYSDSMIVLGYLKNQEKRFKKYVTRRINMILKLFDDSRWHYVNTSENPADIASRRQSMETLSSSCWLSGPPILYTLAKTPTPLPLPNLPETVVDKVTLKTNATQDSIITSILVRSSNLGKAQRVLDMVMKFIRNLKLGRKLDVPSVMTKPENTLKTIIKNSQMESFPELFDSGAEYRGRLLPLSPFQSEDGMIRVGGRLANSDLDYEHKYPILIPKGHPLTKLLISHYHDLHRHQGRCITLSAIRTAGFFVQSGSSVVRKHIRDCVTCKKLRLSLGCQRMADLPPDRVEAVPPFTNTGMDVFGPYEVTDGVSTRRSKATKKTWAVIFSCLNSRAVHLEPLPSLDISSMRNAMRRFFCLRGPCKLLRSDQGTNFVGTRNQDLLSAVIDQSRTFDCRWELNTPKASHHGGVWERPIQSVKRIMTNCISLLANRLLSRDEFSTFLQECGCILNNSPLWEYSADPNDPVPLSPAMLLNLRGNNLEESSDSNDVIAYGSKRWRRVQFLSDQFWSRWKTDYLQTLQKRSKWMSTSRNLSVGDVVLMKDAQSKRHQWPIAKVSFVRISSDGLVRSVELFVPSRGSGNSRTLWRPVSDLCLLVPASA